MQITQAHHFRVRIALLCNYFKLVTWHNFFLCVSFIVFVQVRIFHVNMRDIIIYVTWWWKKYLLKRSLIKHTCLQRDKLLYYEHWTDKRKYFYVKFKHLEPLRYNFWFPLTTQMRRNWLTKLSDIHASENNSVIWLSYMKSLLFFVLLENHHRLFYYVFLKCLRTKIIAFRLLGTIWFL